jgi:uncharacterized protein YbjT (DUF2867 family)
MWVSGLGRPLGVLATGEGTARAPERGYVGQFGSSARQCDDGCFHCEEMSDIEGKQRLGRILVTGATGYLGRALVPMLVQRGHEVRVLVRSGREVEFQTLPQVECVCGDALDAHSVAPALNGCDTLVHLVGVPKPSPTKAEEFRRIDLVSIKASIAAIASSGRDVHLVYLSVAHPAPVMKAYIAVRREGEALIARQGIRATCLRPWYVLGPGHRWPYLLMPVYGVLNRLPWTRESARRLGLVTLSQMLGALLQSIEHPPLSGIRVVDVPAIRSCRPIFQT